MKILKETPTKLYLKFPDKTNVSIINNLKGQKYNKLTVTKFAHTKNGHTYWECRCDCGNQINAEAYNIKTSHTRSCGCEKVRLLKDKSENSWTRVDEYKILAGMLARCNNPNVKSYKYYGGMGVKVCDEWSEKRYGFLEFYRHMGKRPSPKHEIDRINTFGNYEPGNCRWTTRLINARNKRKNGNNTTKP